MSEAIDTSMADTEQAFRAFAESAINPIAASVTGLQVVLDPIAGTLTAPEDHLFENDGMREAQTITLTTESASGTMLLSTVAGNVLTGKMDADFAAIANESDTSGWTIEVAYEKAWQGVAYNEKEGVPYISSAWLPGDSNELEFGAATKNRYREIGIFQVMVNGEDGSGVQNILLAAGAVAGAVRNKYLSFGQSGNIRLRQPSVGKIVAGNGWASVVVSTPYRRDAQPV